MSTQIITRKALPKLQKKVMPTKRITVVEYLLNRLHLFGIAHLFTLDHTLLTTLNIYTHEDPNIDAITLASANALTNVSDGYAKIKRFAACAMTKDTVGFIDNILHAASESLGLVTIIGMESASSWSSSWSCWGSSEYFERALRESTLGWTVLDDPKIAAKKIDRILDYAFHYQMPVCIELMQEVADMFIPLHTPKKTEFHKSDENSLQDFLLHFDDLLLHAKRAVMYVGEEVFAHKVSQEVYAFSERYNIPILRKSQFETLSFQESGYDLVIVFSTNALFCITTAHIVQIGITDAWCDERHYSSLFFKDTVQNLSSLECRKVFKRQKPSVFEKENHAKLTAYRDVIEKCREKAGAQVVVSPKFTHLFPHKLFCENFISTDTSYTPSFTLEQALGAALAEPDTALIAIIDHKDLQSSLEALFLLDVHEIHVVVCTMHEKEAKRAQYRSEVSAINHSWSLSELAHLFVNGNATHVHTPKNFEKALHLALEAKEGLFLIEASI